MIELRWINRRTFHSEGVTVIKMLQFRYQKLNIFQTELEYSEWQDVPEVES